MKSIQCGICGKPVEQNVLYQHLVNNHRWKEIVSPVAASSKPAPQNLPQPKQTRCPDVMCCLSPKRHTGGIAIHASASMQPTAKKPYLRPARHQLQESVPTVML